MAIWPLEPAKHIAKFIRAQSDWPAKLLEFRAEGGETF
jgi:hypothetical protein